MKRFLCTNCTMLHEELFLIGAFGGLPAKMNLNNGKIEYFDLMEGFCIEKTDIIVDFLENFQNRIYALDSKGRYLVVFDLNMHKCQYIPLQCSYRTWINFVAFERYGVDYYIFPKYGNKILVLNIEKNEIEEIDGCLSNTGEVQCACRVEDNVWILPQDANEIYCYNLSSRQKEVCKLKGIVKNCVHAVFHEIYIYILNMYGIIYKWNIEKKELEEIADLEIKSNKMETMSRIIYAGNKLILLPAYGKDIRLLDLLTGQIKLYREYPIGYYDYTEWLKFYGYCEDEKFYYFAMCASNYMLKIDKQFGELIWIKPMTESLVGRITEFFGGQPIYEENFEVIDLLKIKLIEKNQNNEVDVGTRIYCRIAE